MSNSDTVCSLMLSYEVQTGLLQLLTQVLPQGCKSMRCGLITCTTTSSVDEPCQFLWDCYTTQNELTEFGVTYGHYETLFKQHWSAHKHN